MKNPTAGLLFVVSLSWVHPSIAGFAPGTGVAGSLHDMTFILGTGADSMERPCAFCHTPHHASSNLPAVSENLPLWNRSVSYLIFPTPYSWPPPGGGQDMAFDPLIGPSRLCMSCHDGVTAIDAHGGTMGSRGSTVIGGARVLLLDGSHPIGIDYNAVAAQLPGEFADPYQGYAIDIYYSDVAGIYNTVIRGGPDMIADHLYQGKYITCVTCHEPHNKFNVAQDVFIGTTITRNFFLRAKASYSLICLSCHIK